MAITGVGQLEIASIATRCGLRILSKAEVYRLEASVAQPHRDDVDTSLVGV